MSTHLPSSAKSHGLAALRQRMSVRWHLLARREQALILCGRASS
jgi:hypothetical protein